MHLQIPIQGLSQEQELFRSKRRKMQTSVKDMRFHSGNHAHRPSCYPDLQPLCQNLDERKETNNLLHAFDGGHPFPRANRNSVTNLVGTGTIPISSFPMNKSPGERAPVATTTSASSSSEFPQQSDKSSKHKDQKPSNVLSGANYQGDFHPPPGSRETEPPLRSGTSHNWHQLDKMISGPDAPT
jgi:hypothetical protein